MRYLPALDGLRAIAVLAVVCLHAHILPGGFIGVDVFFVLSGYLITQVLADNPDLPRFYWRRAKRLVPALAFMLAVYLIVAPMIVPDYPHARDALLAFFYLSDYSVALAGIPNYLMHTWSLSVEEHFYLLWPLVFLRFRPSVKVLAVAYVLATAWRWNQLDWFFRFDSHCSGLILGCLIAQLPRGRVAAWPGLIVLAVAAVVVAHDSAQWWLSVVEVAAAWAILGRSPDWLAHRWPVYLGKLSYGVYLWHYPIVRLSRLALDHPSAPLLLVISLTASIAMAALSYHTIEGLARSRKRVLVLGDVNVNRSLG